MTPLDISVVICVYTEDRWDDVLAAVTSVRAQSHPAREVLLVVDHNPVLLDRLALEYKETSEVRVLPNAGPRGLSAGRNTGIAASSGEVIAFLDDDAVAERDWLRRFADPYSDPRVLAVGGRCEPVWSSGRRPVWFPEEFDWVVGCSYLGLPPGRIRVRNILGGNASFRRSAFDIVGGFASGIGRDGDKRPLGGEETELCIRLGRERPDAILLVDDRAVIHHKVPAAREHFAYFRTRTYAEGLSKALVARSVGTDKGLESERRYTTRVLPAGVARGLRDALRNRPGGGRRAGAIVAGALTAAGGYVVGTVRARRNGTTFAVVPIDAATAMAGEAVGVPGASRGGGSGVVAPEKAGPETAGSEGDGPETAHPWEADSGKAAPEKVRPEKASLEMTDPGEASSGKTHPEVVSSGEVSPWQAGSEKPAPEESGPETAGPWEACPGKATPEESDPDTARPWEADSEKAAPDMARPEKAGLEITGPGEVSPREAGSREVSPRQAGSEKLAPEAGTP